MYIDEKMFSPSPLILGHASNIAFVHTNHIVMDARWGDLSARAMILTAIFRDRQKKSNHLLAEPETRGLRLCGNLARSVPGGACRLHESTDNIYFRCPKKMRISVIYVSVHFVSTSP